MTSYKKYYTIGILVLLLLVVSLIFISKNKKSQTTPSSVNNLNVVQETEVNNQEIEGYPDNNFSDNSQKDNQRTDSVQKTNEANSNPSTTNYSSSNNSSVNNQDTPPESQGLINNPAKVNLFEIKLIPSPLRLLVNNSWKIKAIVTPNNFSPNLEWKSNNANIATVDSSGFVTGISSGEVEIFARDKDLNISSSIKVLISALDNPTISVISKSSPTETSVPLTTSIPSQKPTNKPQVSAVPTSAPLTKTPTKYNPTSTPQNNKITSIQLVPNSLILEKNTSWKIGVIPTPLGLSPSYLWVSSNGNIATVDVNGLVTGISEGQAIITSKVKNTNISNSLRVIVKLPKEPTSTEVPTKTPTSIPTRTPTAVITIKPTEIQPEKNTDISINIDYKITQVPKDFLGFSTEKGSLCKYMETFKDNSILSKLYSNLSPAVWRIGGNTVESVNWEKSAVQCGDNSVNAKLVDDVFNFANKVNWKVIYGVNLKNNTLAKAKDESLSVLSKYSSSLHSLEIGNEPDLYDDWDFSTYQKKWSEYANGVKSLPYSFNIIGPSSIGQMNNQNPSRLEFFENFIRSSKSLISSSSFHLYPISKNILEGLDNNDKAKAALDKERTEKTKQVIKSFSQIGKEYSVPVRLAETSIGGDFEVSDTYSSTLWTLNYLFSVLESGIKGVNMHGYHISMRNHYSPIWATSEKVPFATPQYYGLLFFKQAAKNGYLVSLNTETSLNLNAYAIENNDKKLQLAIINKEINKKAVIKINSGVSYKSASAIWLKAPSLTTKITNANDSKITLGGNPVSQDGSWNEKTRENISLSNKSTTIVVPPISAVLITFEP